MLDSKQLRSQSREKLLWGKDLLGGISTKHFNWVINIEMFTNAVEPKRKLYLWDTPTKDERVDSARGSSFVSQNLTVDISFHYCCAKV